MATSTSLFSKHVPIPRWILGLAAAVLLPTASWAGDPPELKAAKKGCEAGNAAECYAAGSFYKEGDKVDRDTKKAAVFYSKGCEGGVAKACTEVGELYKSGDGVEKDPIQAVVFLSKACDGGEFRVCDSLGRDFVSGALGRDGAKAAAFFEKACAGGLLQACYNGALNLNRTLHDAAHALSLYEKGCAAGDVASCYNAGTMTAEGKGVPKDSASPPFPSTRPSSVSLPAPATT
jgi:TPR repeat protein